LAFKPDLSPLQRGGQRVELHDRIAACSYPFIFALIAFAALGYAASARSGRAWALAAAAGTAIGIRLLGFWASQQLLHIPEPFFILYLPLMTTALIALTTIIARDWFAASWALMRSQS
jgi:lipopolysaccharide export system permease protein